MIRKSQAKAPHPQGSRHKFLNPHRLIPSNSDIYLDTNPEYSSLFAPTAKFQYAKSTQIYQRQESTAKSLKHIIPAPSHVIPIFLTRFYFRGQIHCSI